jgi:hypothetical protein
MSEVGGRRINDSYRSSLLFPKILEGEVMVIVYTIIYIRAAYNRYIIQATNSVETSPIPSVHCAKPHAAQKEKKEKKKVPAHHLKKKRFFFS